MKTIEKKIAANKRPVRTPEVLQMEAAECGAASLSMILRYYGCWVSLEELREACGVSRNGCTASGILSAARQYGMKGGGFRTTSEKLRKAPLPCVLFWNDDHFVVLEGFWKNKVLIPLFFNQLSCDFRVRSYGRIAALIMLTHPLGRPEMMK